MKKGIDYPAITVSYLCHDGKGNYLMNKRGANCRDERGTWDFGGGGLDLGLTVEQTLRKELLEEYCAEPVAFSFLGYSDIFREQDGVRTHWVGLDFLVQLDPKQVKNGEPHKFDEVAWFRLDALPAPLHSQVLPSLAMYRDKLPDA